MHPPILRGKRGPPTCLWQVLFSRSAPQISSANPGIPTLLGWQKLALNGESRLYGFHTSTSIDTVLVLRSYCTGTVPGAGPLRVRAAVLPGGGSLLPAPHAPRLSPPAAHRCNHSASCPPLSARLSPLAVPPPALLSPTSPRRRKRFRLHGRGRPAFTGSQRGRVWRGLGGGGRGAARQGPLCAARLWGERDCGTVYRRGGQRRRYALPVSLSPVCSLSISLEGIATLSLSLLCLALLLSLALSLPLSLALSPRPSL